MNRNEEFRTYLRELEETPVRGGDVTRAKRKLRRKNALRALGSVAAALALVMVVLLNVSPTVAKAVSDLPGMEGIVRAVRLGRALEEARDLGYAQPIDWEGQAGDMTFHVDYMLADETNVSVFFRAEAEQENPAFLARTGTLSGDAGSIANRSYVIPLGEGRYCARLRFDDGTPEFFQLTLGLQSEGQPVSPDRQVVLRLEPDPEKTMPNRIATVNKTFLLDGQTVTLTRVEINLHQMEMTFVSAQENQYDLTGLEFSLRTEDGHRLESSDLDVGWSHEPGVVTLTSESPVFYEYGDLTLEITGADWRQKEKPLARIDLANETAEDLPEAVSLLGAERDGDGWLIRLRYDDPSPWRLFVNLCYGTPDGRRGHLMETSSRTVWSGAESYRLFTLHIPDYPGTEVWLAKTCDRIWRAEGEPLTLVLPLGED